jgi:HlyD family secretion protein
MKRLIDIGRTVPFLMTVFLCASCAKKEKPVFEGSGTFEATEIVIGAKAAGTVIDLAVQEGDTVGEGQVIARIETEKIDLQKKQLFAGLAELRLNIQNAERVAGLAQESFDAMQKKFNRIRSLREGASISEQQYEDAETGYKAARTQNENAAASLKALRAKEEQARIQLELADSQLRDATVLSPIRGTVLETYIDCGEIARPGGAVATLADLSRMWIKIYIKEQELGRIRLKDEAVLKISSDPEKEFKGRVSWISDRAEFTPKMVQTKDARSDLVYAVKIEVSNPDGVLKIGMPADVVLNPVGR